MRLSVHPESKSKVVKTKKKRKHRNGKRRKRVVNQTHFIVTGVWASAALPADQVFDVQQQRADGSWMTVRDGTAALSGQFDVGTAAGKTVGFRARVRRGNDPIAASGLVARGDGRHRLAAATT